MNYKNTIVDELGGPGNRSAARIAVDLAAWLLLARLGQIGPVWSIGCVAAIGAIVMHDLLVHGHEATHGLITRWRPVNEFCLWLTFATVGMSGSAYRAFHLAHHAHTNQPDDPEIVFYSGGRGNPSGWDYLRIPWLSHWLVNTWAWHHASRHTSQASTTRDLAGAALLHGAVLSWSGPVEYATWVLLPMFTGLSLVFVVRSLCEHHDTWSQGPFRRARALVTHPLVDLLWSNVSHHLEHHLCPTVAAERLPEVRRRLWSSYEREGSIVENGYIRTAARLLLERHHRREDRCLVDSTSLPYRLKVQWFKDILSHTPTRQYLWSLYYAGEAYEELHPDGMLAHKLPEPERKLWQRQMRDETRHSGIFRGLLAAEGESPAPLEAGEDVAWYLINHILPDIVQRVGEPGEFNRTDLVRYMAFLHSLELRSIYDLCALRSAASELGLTPVVDAVTDILKDERFHAAYCHKAVRKYSASPTSVFVTNHKAERRFYTQAMRRVLSHLKRLGACPPTLWGRLRWTIMEGLAWTGLAFPRLPLLERFPSRLI